MSAGLTTGRLFEHASTAGAASEQQWIDLFHRYLPARYRATPAFVIDSSGNRSRQIDIAIYDNLYSPLLFPHTAGPHIAAESVYAIFEVKATFSRQFLQDAAIKAKSVRKLKRTSIPIIASGHQRPSIRPQPILAGLLATTSVWNPEAFADDLRGALVRTDLDIGCCLEHGSFERRRDPGQRCKMLHISHPNESLIFFLLRLIDRLRQMGTAPAADLMQYARHLRSA